MSDSSPIVKNGPVARRSFAFGLGLTKKVGRKKWDREGTTQHVLTRPVRLSSSVRWIGRGNGMSTACPPLSAASSCAGWPLSQPLSQRLGLGGGFRLCWDRCPGTEQQSQMLGWLAPVHFAFTASWERLAGSSRTSGFTPAACHIKAWGRASAPQDPVIIRSPTPAGLNKTVRLIQRLIATECRAPIRTIHGFFFGR